MTKDSPAVPPWQGIPYTDDEPDAEGLGDQQHPMRLSQPQEQDRPFYTDEERLVWLEEEYERRDVVHQGDVEALKNSANKQNRLIKQIQDL